uniref:GDSL esterase/lipase n=1 Tax=Leersia perrieri TaxID=77586 RepID=A0A0D9WCF2_9ORYZ
MRSRSSIGVFVLLLLQLSGLMPGMTDGRCIVFNFGDSNSDTGNFIAAYGLYLGPPSGRRFFHHPTGRWSDGRLYIDFIAEKLKISYLSPYMESSGSNFTSGVNLAVAGAAVSSNKTGAIPLGLDTQVNQFLHFKNRTRDLAAGAGAAATISEGEFTHDAVYSIDAGQNDVALAFLAGNLTLPEINLQLAAAAARIGDAVRALHATGGARKFWVYNTGPIGCLPQTLALRQKPGDELDAAGCLAAYNAAARQFNAELAAVCRRLAADLDDAVVVCVDMYGIKYDMFLNHGRYGFDRPLMACCGHGGPPYNYANLKTCGQPTATACPEGERHVSWDGVHYTEDANAIVAEKVLSGHFSTPRVKLTALCK